MVPPLGHHSHHYFYKKIMLIKGFEKTTLIDYPGHLASIIFVGGCNFRCDYCYNKDLVLCPAKLPSLSEHDILHELEKRKNFIDGLVITGGEPTLQPDLADFIKKVRALNLKIKLDSNGYNPEIIKALLAKNLLDYIAMDIKAPLKRYAEIAGVPINTNKITKSIELIMRSGIAYEFRTTVWRDSFSPEEFKSMFGLINGAQNYYLQNMYPHFPTPPKQTYDPMLKSEIEPILALSKQFVQQSALRGTWR